MKKVLCLLIIIFTLTPSTSVPANSSVTMYALDGRSINVPENEVTEWKAVGWYSLPPITMYALDGREIKVPGEKVGAYEKVGWYLTPPATVYALDGRVKKVPQDRVEDYLNVGWYKEEPVAMIARDYRILYVPANDVEAYKKVGWFIRIHPSEYGAAYAENMRDIIDEYGKFEQGGMRGLRYGVLIDFERDMVPELVLLHDLTVEVYRYNNGTSSKIYSADVGARYGQTDVSYTFSFNDTAFVPYLVTYHSKNEWTEENLEIFTLKDGAVKVKTMFAKTTGIDMGFDILNARIDGQSVTGKEYALEREKIEAGLVSVFASGIGDGGTYDRGWDFLWATKKELNAFLRQFGL